MKGKAFLLGLVLAGNILYQENFNSSASGWLPHKEGWSLDSKNGFSGGAYHYSWREGLEEDSFAILGGKNWRDFSFEAKVKANSGNVGIAVRMSVDDITLKSPEVKGYRLVLTPKALRFQRYRLIQPNGKKGDHTNPFTLVEKPFNFVYGQWYTLKIEAKGANFRCYVNGKLEIEYDDVSAMTEDELKQGYTHPQGPIFPEGSIGFVEWKANAWWDDVLVKSLGEDKVGEVGDLNGDGLVNQEDLNILFNNWGTYNERDLTTLLANWKDNQAKEIWPELRQEDWFGSWKWEGSKRVSTSPEDNSLIIHYSDQPFEVVFWDGRDGGTKMPHWRPVNDRSFGVSPVWFESGDAPNWEVLFTDRSLIKLEILEQRKDFIRVRWWYKPTKERDYGGTGFEVHRGNTEVEQIFDFYANGLTEIKMNIKLGNKDFSKQSGNDLELSEWNFLFPKNLKPLDVIGREGKLVRVLNPYSDTEVAMGKDGNLDKDQVNNWKGQIHVLLRKNPGADFFIIWGKKYHPQPPNFPDLYQRVARLYYRAESVEMVWPKPSCNVSAPLMTRALLPSSTYTANLEYRWLVGMGPVENLNLRKIARDWLDLGKID